MTETMLALGEAADQLGVHPVTLRRWARKGKIRVVRTPGGHRRFPESEIRRLQSGAQTGSNELPQSDDESSSPVTRRLHESALQSTRQDLRDVSGEPWARELGPKDREEKRVLGRRLMGLMMQYIALDNGEGEDILEEARIVGRIYAKSIVQSGLKLSEALRATMFFRDHIVESAVVLPEAANRRPEANQKMFRRLNSFLNEIQIVIATAYDSNGASSASPENNLPANQ